MTATVTGKNLPSEKILLRAAAFLKGFLEGKYCYDKIKSLEVSPHTLNADFNLR